MSQQSAGRLLGGRYRLIREIARGGMGAVWAAEDTLLDRHVAVKLLHPQYADDPEFLERFRREARAAARLSHPNIVSIFDVGEDAETHTPFIVMELVEGGNLKERIRRHAPLAEEEIRSVGAALAATLEYAHQRGIIHRDVKPQNVLLGEDGRPRLTDFGIAQAMTSQGLTRTGAVMGSVQYLAPELIRGRVALPQSDLYSLGVVLYEMATGRVPFEADTDLAVALAHVEELPPAPRALNAHLRPDLERIILHSLAKSPEDRFSSGGELASELRHTAAPPVALHARPRAEAVTQRLPTVPAIQAGRPKPRSSANAAAGAAAAVPVGQAAPGAARRTARPRQGRGAGGGVLALLLALAAVLVALGAGLFGLATLSREGVATPVPTAPAPPTAVSKPAAAPTGTPVPAVPTTEPTPAPSPTAQPSPSPLPPTPSPVPPSPTPAPQPSPTPRSIAAPPLAGKTLEDARAALQAAGLTATIRGVNANVERNIVADQNPVAGTLLPPGGTVAVLVGTGSTTIPEVANMPRDQALKTLQNNSFQVNVRERRDQRVPAGNAIGTTPGAGTVLARKSDIELNISIGR